MRLALDRAARWFDSETVNIQGITKLLTHFDVVTQQIVEAVRLKNERKTMTNRQIAQKEENSYEEKPKENVFADE